MDNKFQRLTIFTSSKLTWNEKKEILCLLSEKLTYDNLNIYTTEGINCDKKNISN